LVRSVWVVDLDWGQGGWMSVHRSKKGAEHALEQQAEALGIDLDRIDSGEDTACTYGLSYLPVEK
jgi:hypothetical protein